MTLDDISRLLKDDLVAVDQEIREQLSSDVALINQLGHYIVNAGGKRLRPLLVLLAAKACQYAGSHHIRLAATVEFIHTATLLHDDVVDASDLRRGRDSANAVWGNEASVLVGDFLYSRAFQMMVTVNNMAIQKVFAAATNRIAEGEVLQLLNVHDADTDEARYFDVITRKTAKLFEAASEIGGLLGGVNETQLQALRDYGLKLGVAFQLIDDVLDYSADSSELGKNIGDDLAEGKPTLPLIYAMHHADNAESLAIRKAIENGGRENLDAILETIRKTGALEYTRRHADRFADEALQSLKTLPNNSYTEALAAIVDIAVHRSN